MVEIVLLNLLHHHLMTLQSTWCQGNKINHKNTLSKAQLCSYIFTLLNSPQLKSLWSFYASVFCLDIELVKWEWRVLTCVVRTFPTLFFHLCLLTVCIQTHINIKACVHTMQYGTRASVQSPSCCSVKVVHLTMLIVMSSSQQRSSTPRTLLLTR